MKHISSFLAGVALAGIIAAVYLYSSNSRCIARAELARAQYRLDEQVRNGEIAMSQKDFVALLRDRQVIRKKQYRKILEQLKQVPDTGCVYPKALYRIMNDVEEIK